MSMKGLGFAERLTVDFFTECRLDDDLEFEEATTPISAAGGPPLLSDRPSFKDVSSKPIEETIKSADILERIAEKGIDVYKDPRCAPVLDALRSQATKLRSSMLSPKSSSTSPAKPSGPLRERIPRQELTEIIRKNAGFFKRIFEAGLIIDNWPHFSGRIQGMYEQVEICGRDVGNVADYIPQLAKVDPKYWGVSITTVDGQRLNIGDTDVDFTVQSCSKVISYCIAQEQNGHDYVHYFVGREPSGEQFNALKLDDKGRPHNPCINSGAIMTCSLIQTPTEMAEKRRRQAEQESHSGGSSEDREDEKTSDASKLLRRASKASQRQSVTIHSGPAPDMKIYAPGLGKRSPQVVSQEEPLPPAVSDMYAAADKAIAKSDDGSIVLRDSERFEYVCSVWSDLFGGDKLNFNNPTYLSERATGHRNFALAHFMKEQNPGFPPGTDIVKNLEFYFQCCSLEANASQMSLLAATLANYGVNPITKKKVFSAVTVQNCLSIMYSCGMYNYSGEHSFQIGIPSKSGVGGCIISVLPGVMGIATFSPKLDDFGNSHRGVEFLKRLSGSFGFHTFQRTKRGRSGIGYNNNNNDGPPDLFRDQTIVLEDMVDEIDSEEEEMEDSSLELEDSPAAVVTFPKDTLLSLDDTGKLSKMSKVSKVSKAKSVARSVMGMAPDSVAVYQCVFSASNGDLITLKTLFVKGRDLTLGDYDSRTPLHLAASNGYLDVVTFLVKEVYPVIKGKPVTDDPKSSTINPVDRWGNTPMDDAIRETRPAIVKILRRYGGIEGTKLRDLICV